MAGRGGVIGVVVVDPWPIVRLGIARALPGLSYRVLAEAASASEATTVVRRSRPHLVVIGTHLADDAPHLVAVAKEADSRVVALVDRSGREELAALATAGVDGLLEGSSTPQALLAAVERVLGGERVLAPSLLPALVGVVRPDSAGDPAAGAFTEREREVLACLVRGAGNVEIAEQLYLSPATVKTHLSHIYAKLGVRNRHEAMARVIQMGLLR